MQPNLGPRARSPIADLPPNVSVYRVEASKGHWYWRVQVGKRFTGGEVISKNFHSIQDARQWIFGDAQKLKANPGSLLDLKATAPALSFSLTPARLAEACDAFRRLDEIQMTLTEAIDFVVKRARPSAGTISVGEAIEKAALMKKESKKRPAYTKNLLRRWRRFERWLPAAKRKAINSVTQMDVRKFLTECKLKPVGEANQRRNLSVLFSWAANHHYVTANPCKGVKVEQYDDEEEPPRVLSIAEVTHLLSVARRRVQTPLMAGKGKPSIITVEPGDLVPYLAVGLWAGVRPEESVRMEWQHIDFERRHLDLPAKITKDRQRRITSMEPNLIKWLMPYRPADGQGKIVVNWRWKFQAFAKAARFSPWPKDCLRHSYASYHLAKFRHAGDTAVNMGHVDPRMLYRHYRDVIKEQKDVDEYWTLDPEKVALLAQQMNLPSKGKNSLGNPTAKLADQPVEIHLRKATAESKGRREFSDAEVQQIKAEREQGATYPALAKKWHCSKSTLSYMLSETAPASGYLRKAIIA